MVFYCWLLSSRQSFSNNYMQTSEKPIKKRQSEKKKSAENKKEQKENLRKKRKRKSRSE